MTSCNFTSTENHGQHSRQTVTIHRLLTHSFTQDSITTLTFKPQTLPDS